MKFCKLRQWQCGFESTSGTNLRPLSSVQINYARRVVNTIKDKDDRALSGIMDTSTADLLVNARYNGQVLQLKVSPHTTWEVLRQQVTNCVYFEKARLS